MKPAVWLLLTLPAARLSVGSAAAAACAQRGQQSEACVLISPWRRPASLLQVKRERGRSEVSVSDNGTVFASILPPAAASAASEAAPQALLALEQASVHLVRVGERLAHGAAGIIRERLSARLPFAGILSETDEEKLARLSRSTSMLQAQPKDHNWVMILTGAVVAVVCVMALWRLGSYLSSPSRYLSGSSLLQHNYDEAQSQADAIKAALEQMKIEDILKQEAEARERLKEQAVAGMDLVTEALADAEAQAAAATLAMKETTKAFAGELPKETEDYLKGAAGQVMEQAGPALARAGHLYNVLQEETTGVRERAVEFAKKEAVGLSMKLQECFTLSEEQLAQLEKVKVPKSVDFMQMLQAKTGDLSDWELPPISLFVAAIFAPGQLQWVKMQDRLHVCVSGFIVAVTVGCIVMDWGQDCRDVLVWVWAAGYLTLSALDVLLRCINMRRVAIGLAKLQEDDTQKPTFFSTGNKIWDIFLQMQTSSDSVFRAFFAYNDLVNSWIFVTSRWLGVLIFFWNIFGVSVAMADVVEDSLHCHAQAVVVWMRIRSFIFVLLLLFTIVQIVLTVIIRLQVVETAIMGAAVSADADSEFPIVSIICRSIMMQEQRVELKLREAMIQEEIKVLQEEQDRAAAQTRAIEEKIAKRSADMSRIHDERMSEERATNQQRIEKYAKKAQKLLSTAEPVVAMAAARLDPNLARGGDAGAGDRREPDAPASSSSAAARPALGPSRGSSGQGF